MTTYDRLARTIGVTNGANVCVMTYNDPGWLLTERYTGGVLSGLGVTNIYDHLMASANPFRFSTKYQDNESDLTYYGYRYYSASTGRWLSRDPIGEAGGVNLYGFNYNDLLNRFDYLGLADPSFKELFFANLYESVQSTSAGYTINYALFDALPRAYNAANEAVLNPYDTLVAGVQGIKNLSVASYTIVKNGQTEAAIEQLRDFSKRELSTHEGWVDLTFGIEGFLTPGGWLKKLNSLEELADAGKLCEKAANAAPRVVNAQTIQAALDGSTMRTAQAEVSIPAVERYVRMLESGSSAPTIKVADGVIIDGNHRFVAGRIFGVEPPIAPGTLSPSQAGQVRPIQQLNLNPADFGNH